MLKNIDFYIGTVIMMFGIVAFAKIVLNKTIKTSKTKLIIIILVTSVIYTLTYLYMNQTVKTLINCILQAITFKYIFKIDYTKAIYTTILYFIILLIIEVMVFVLLFKVINISQEFGYNILSGGILSNTITCIGLVSTALLLKEPLQKVINYKISDNIKIIILGILTVVCITMFFYMIINNFKNHQQILPYIIIIVFSLIMLFTLVKQSITNNNITKKYEQILEFMTTFEDEVEKQRILRHETKNAFLTIKAQLTDGDKEKEIIEYINSILKEDTKMKYEEYAKFKYLPANGIKGLCYYKVQEAENKGIKTSINISPRIEKSFLSKLTVDERKELGKILGVFLDNAIEASTNSTDKKLGFEAYMIDKNVKIIISNSYEGKVDTNKIGQERYSTKGKKRGHGLLLVKSILNNNNMFETKTDITENLYIQNITIKKPTENMNK